MREKTPFFKAFGSLLFGRQTKKATTSLRGLKSLGELYEMFGELIPDQLLDCEEAGPNSRRRQLTRQVTFWAFVWQVLNPGSPCREVVRKVEAWWRWANRDRTENKAVSTSAYCQARRRLDMETLRLVFNQITWTLERRVLSEEKWLNGRQIKIVDGTTVSMPDTAGNQACWPQSSLQKPGLGFPLMKLVGLFSLSSGALLEYETSNLHEHEHQLFRALWKRLKRGDIVLGDRAFSSYGALAALASRGVDCVFRLHQARKADFREGKKLGKDDRLVIWQRPGQRSRAWEKEEFDALPETLPVRLIRLVVSTPGFRTHEVILVTTLTDSVTYPADALRELYAKRWNVELHFHQIKHTLDLDVLRCLSPDMIEKELIIHLIAYNMVRCLMQRAAHLHHAPLERISFKGSLDTARHFGAAIYAASSSHKRQDDLILQMLAMIASDPVPGRPGRSEPRARKRRPRNYQLLTKPRHQMGNLPHRNRPEQGRPKTVLS